MIGCIPPKSSSFHNLRNHRIRGGNAQSVLLPVIFQLIFLSGCTTYGENGSLVRHHFGYVRVITPVVHAENKSVRALTLKTMGVWLDVDKRDASNRSGSGLGLGYRSDHREMIPLDCRWVVRVTNKQQMDQFLQRIEELNLQEGGLCMVQETL